MVPSHRPICLREKCGSFGTREAYNIYFSGTLWFEHRIDTRPQIGGAGQPLYRGVLTIMVMA